MIGGSLWLNSQQRKLARGRTGFDKNTFCALVEERGVDQRVAAIVWDELEAYCAKGVLPHPDDDVSAFYHIDDEEVCDILERIFTVLNLSIPEKNSPLRIPVFNTVQDILFFINQHNAQNPH